MTTRSRIFVSSLFRVSVPQLPFFILSFCPFDWAKMNSARFFQEEVKDEVLNASDIPIFSKEFLAYNKGANYDILALKNKSPVILVK